MPVWCIQRFATEEYCEPTPQNMGKRWMHLTNYSLNRENPKFVKNKGEDGKGHKWSLSALFNRLESFGVNTEEVWGEISDIIIKTLAVIQPTLAHTYSSCQPHDITHAMCFEILGFDIMLDSNLRCWLLEVNHSPAFSAASSRQANQTSRH